MATNKGFIKDFNGNTLLPITRAELVLDSAGNIALQSDQFLAGGTDNNPNQLPGLITAAERAMLKGSGTQNIGDLYTKVTDLTNKVKYINEGLVVGNKQVYFYDSTGAKTPININTDKNISITHAVDNTNNITIALNTVGDGFDIENKVLKNITVDTYGRVTAVESGLVISENIDTTLSNKQLDNCTVTSTPTDDSSVVNKQYVDALFDMATTGSLIFGGAVSQNNYASLLQSEYNNHYYKATGSFSLAEAYLHPNFGNTSDVTVKVGDTLIVCSDTSDSQQSYKFVWIPSGDDITTITVKKGENNILTKAINDVTLKFASPFDVTSADNTATISLPKAGYIGDSNNVGSGYLSADDWKRFNSYANQGAIVYTPDFQEDTNTTYKIGVLSVGETSTAILGKDYTTSLQAVNSDGPSLQLTQTGQDDTIIPITGSKGIEVSLDNANGGFNIKTNLKGASQPLPTDTTQQISFITIQDGKNSQNKSDGSLVIGVKLGTVNSEGNVEEHGLVEIDQLHTLATNVRNKFANMVEIIGVSLATGGNVGDKYYKYGSQDLQNAITITV